MLSQVELYDAYVGVLCCHNNFGAFKCYNYRMAKAMKVAAFYSGLSEEDGAR